MKTVHKYRLDVSGKPKTLQLREGFRLVRCEYLVADKAVFLWVEEPLAADTPIAERGFRVVYSGEPVPESYRYVDTALDPFGPEAYHVYALPAGEAPFSIPLEANPARALHLSTPARQLA